MKTRRKKACCWLWEVQQRGNKRDPTWAKVNQTSSLGLLCGRPGGSWARDHITGMCFRKVTWQPWKWDGRQGTNVPFPRTVSSYSYFTKSNVLGSDVEPKKEATNWLSERISHLVITRWNHTICWDEPLDMNMEIKLRTKELYKARNINM